MCAETGVVRRTKKAIRITRRVTSRPPVRADARSNGIAPTKTILLDTGSRVYVSGIRTTPYSSIVITRIPRATEPRPPRGSPTPHPTLQRREPLPRAMTRTPLEELPLPEVAGGGQRADER